MQSRMRVDYKNLKIALKRSGVSINALSKSLGISKSSLYGNIKSKNPTVGFIVSLADFFGVDPMYFLTEKEGRWWDACTGN